MVSRVGIEPTTNWLKAKCSTPELPAHPLLKILSGINLFVKNIFKKILLLENKKKKTILYIET